MRTKEEIKQKLEEVNKLYNENEVAGNYIRASSFLFGKKVLEWVLDKDFLEMF